MTFVDAKINDRWELVLPDFRRDFHAARPPWEAGRLASCAETIQPGMTVYDVGAEHGDFTALYKIWVGPSGTVIPIEPAPAYWPCIRETWEANRLGDSDGWFAGFASDVTRIDPPRAYHADLELDEQGWPAMSHGDVREDPGFRHLAQQSRDTPQIRLDALDILGYRPDVIVIDVEGAELRVLNGCTRIFEDGHRPTFYVSVHDVGEWNPLAGWYGATLDDIHAFMAGYGYQGCELPNYGEGEHFWLYQETR